MTSARKQSFVGADGFDILFDGSKSFWKTRTNLDILVASHKKQLCIELVAYNAEVGVEAPRIYMSSMMLATKINPQSEEFINKLSTKKESLTRQKKAFSAAELTKEVYNEMILNYILQRLNVVSEGVDLTKELKMVITPQSSDTVNEEGTVDFVLPVPPTGLTPVVVTYTKKASASEISRAQHKLQTESAALKNATRLAELATSATENFKAMMEEKRRIALEMQAFTPARLRWIRAINRVLIANYIENVKTRLLNSSFAEWYTQLMEKVAAEEAAEAEAAAAAEKAAAVEREAVARQRAILAANTSSKSSRSSNATDRAKNKVARRSLDNSQLPSLAKIDITQQQETSSTKSISNGGSAQTASLPQLQGLGSPSSKNRSEKLLLDPMERRRQAKAEREANGTPTSAKITKLGKALSRKSFGGETEAELAKFQAGLASPSFDMEEKVKSSAPAAVPVPAANTGRPPSLLESYSTKGAMFTSIPNIDTSENGKGPKLLESKSVPRRARA